MEHAESELYTLKRQFFTNQHRLVIGYDLESFSDEYRLNALAYQIRSKVALKEDASSLIDEGRAKYEDNDSLFDLLQAWNDLATFGTDGSTYFNDVKEYDSEVKAVLTTIYLVKFDKDIDQALDRLSKYVAKNSLGLQLEAMLYLVQLYLLKGQVSAASKVFLEFKRYPDEARESIIFEILDAWMQALRVKSELVPQPSVSNAFYFFSSFDDFDDDKEGELINLVQLLVLFLQQKHFYEAEELMEKLQALKIDKTSDLIANLITYDILVKNGANWTKLLPELKAVDEEHQLLVDLKEKNAAFDEIVAKYNVSV